MTLEYQFRPIDQWPGEKCRSRKRSPFDVGFNRLIEDLGRELKYLGAKTAVIQVAVDGADVRNDGMLRARVEPRWPGVILSFTSKHGPLSYPCDTYTDWRGNLRAISLGMSALRAVERYGVTRNGEQYKGWAALPPPNGDGWTVKEAREFLELILGVHIPPGQPAAAMEPFLRYAERKTHPDVGGNPDDFKKVQRARQLIMA